MAAGALDLFGVSCPSRPSRLSCLIEQFAGRPHGALSLPERRAAIVAERVQRADVGERDDFVAAHTGPRDEIIEGDEPPSRRRSDRLAGLLA